MNLSVSLRVRSRTAHSPPRTRRGVSVLEILVARRPNVVSKDVLLETVWSGKTVEEANLAIAVGEIERAPVKGRPTLRLERERRSAAVCR